MPQGASAKRERQHRDIKKSAVKSGKTPAPKSSERARSGKTSSAPQSSKANARSRRKPGVEGRGFASMSRARQRQIASEGGRAAHEQGTAHEFSTAEARAAGQKGGRRVSRNRRHMAEIGRKGGKS